MKKIILLLVILGFNGIVFGQMTSNTNTNTPTGLRVKHASFEIIQKHSYKGTQEINRIELKYRDLNYGFFFRNSASWIQLCILFKL